MKRSPLVDPEPEEPSGHTWTGTPSIDASKIMAGSVTGHRIGPTSRTARETDKVTEYIANRYSTDSPARGLWQRTKGYWENDS